jgi:hypothetical protein
MLRQRAELGDFEFVLFSCSVASIRQASAGANLSGRKGTPKAKRPLAPYVLAGLDTGTRACGLLYPRGAGPEVAEDEARPPRSGVARAG